ncbi:MAG: hypothetical protein KDC05_03635, partial [Bacteroidales bacterium]|nr:hypothetical protein [Bacteroidales bacterium]
MAQDFEISDHITSEDGLPQNTVNCILQDNKGFIWIGTQDGLCRYDGNQFQIYQNIPSDTNSLSNNYVLSICEDGNGMIWAGTMSGGLNRIDPSGGRFQRYMHDPENAGSISENNIWCVAADSNNTIYAGTNKGLNILEAGSRQFNHYNHAQNDPATIPSDIVISLFTSEKQVLIGTNAGLASFNPLTSEIKRINLKPHNDNKNQPVIWSIKQLAEAGTILGTAKGLCIFNENDQLSQVFSVDQKVWNVLPDNNTLIWLGTTKGIHIVNRENNLTITTNPGGFDLSGNTWCLMQDRSGLIWAGTDQGLFSFIEKKSLFTVINDREESFAKLNNPSVNAILEDKNGNIWIGTEGGGLNRMNRHTGEITYFKSGKSQNCISGNSIWALLESRDGRIWIGTYGNDLDVFDPFTETFTHFRSDFSNPQALSNSRILVLHEDKKGDIWIGTRGGGLNRYDSNTGRFEVFKHDPENQQSISSSTILSLSEDQKGNLWIGTFEGGLCRMDHERNSFHRYKNEPGNEKSLSNNNVWVIHFDKKNQMWLGTQGGLNLVKNPEVKMEFIQFNTKHGLPGNVIFGLAEDRTGNIWMSTFKGIARLNRSQFEALHDFDNMQPDPLNPLFKCFDKYDGLPGNEFNQGAWFQSSPD